MKLKLKVEPTPRGRAKVTSISGFFTAYTPKKTRKAEALIRGMLQERNLEPYPAGIPLKLTVTFYRTKPKCAKARDLMPFRKPDLSNFLGLLEDSMTGILFADDAQITTEVVKKRWSPKSQAMSRKKKRTGKELGYIILELQEDKP